MRQQHAIKLKPTHIRTEKMPVTKRRQSRFANFNDALYGCGTFFLLREYQQRCVVKVSYIQNGQSRAWAAHGDYLQREHAQTPGERGLGLNAERDDIDLKELLRAWQKANDPLLFKIIVSPENGYKMDLHQHAKDLMQQMQIDLDTKLEWAAIDHHNTDYPHLHIVVRGLDEKGKELRIESGYLKQGIRERSQVLASRELGFQRNQDLVQQRQQQVERDQVTKIDYSLRHRANDEGVISFKQKVADNAMAREWRLQEIARLKYLATMDLAKQLEPRVWQLSPQLENTLHQLKFEDSIVEARARHGIEVTYREELKTTQIDEDSPLTGKVVGMGLENELYDKRYLIVEGTDGKAHYLQASNNMIKQHDEGVYRNGDVVTIERNHYTRADDTRVSYLSVESHGDLDHLKNTLYSKLDDDTLDFVKATGCAPQLLHHEKCFGHEYAEAMIERFEEFKDANLFYFDRDDGSYWLVSNWEERYEWLIDEREQALKLDREPEHALEISLESEHEFGMGF